MSVIREMIEILDEEYHLLVHGTYNALPDLLERKQALENRLHDDTYRKTPEMQALSKALERNAGAISAAARGFEQARNLIRDIREGLNQATYDRDGARMAMSRSPSSLERKL